ncbi:sialic acid-binding Ig-like lectin 12 [Cetorhinus maximus]
MKVMKIGRNDCGKTETKIKGQRLEQGTSSIAFHSKLHNHEFQRFRYQTRLSGDLKDGDCFLIINNITREDAGPYYFRIEFDSSNSYSYYPATELHVSVGLSHEWKGDTPREVTAQEGSCVQIPCHYSYPSELANQPRDGVWFNIMQRHSFIAFHSKDHNHELPRFCHQTQLSGGLKDGNCSLVIKKITREDAGSYFFRIEFDSKNRYNYYPVTQLHVSAELSQEWKSNTPREVTTQEGSCVQIPCHHSYPSCLENQPRVGIWFSTGKHIHGAPIAFHPKDHNQELPQFRHRTWLSGDLKDGDCSLIINNVRREDAGPYFFRIEFDSKNRYNYYPVTQLHVSDFTDKPTIFPAEIIAGKRVDVSCTFTTTCNGTAAPVLTWDIPTDIPGSVSNTVTQHGVTLTYTSVLTLIPSLKHHGQTLSCRVRYPSVSSERTLILTVQSAASNEWKAGLLGAGICLSVGLSGLFIFKCVRKRSSTGRSHSVQAERVGSYSAGEQSDWSWKKDEMYLEMKPNCVVNPYTDVDLYKSCVFADDPVYVNL